MTGGGDSLKLSNSQPPIPDDVTKGVFGGLQNPSVQRTGADAPTVKRAPKSDEFRPILPEVSKRKATLLPQKPRLRKYIDGADRKILPAEVKFQVPPEPLMEKHGRAVVTAAGATSAAVGGGVGGVVFASGTSALATAIGTAVGSAAGSVVPVVGTAIGAVAGFAIGGLVGYLIRKFGRSHSEHRYFDNAIKSLQKHGVKFTEKEMKRLKAMRPEQWQYLTKYQGVIIDALKDHSGLWFRGRRWAKQYYYQYAAMAVAKLGYRRTQHQLSTLNWSVGRAWRPASLVSSEMYAKMDEWGVGTFDERKSVHSVRNKATVNRQQSLATQKWNELLAAVNEVYGKDGADHFENRNKRYIEVAANPGKAIDAFNAAGKLRKNLRAFIEDRIRPYYDRDIRLRVLKLVDKYALDFAVGDVPKASFYDAHGNFDKELISELIHTAARLQNIKDSRNPPSSNKKKDRAPPDVVVRRATLLNRISGHAAVSDRSSYWTSQRFINDAADNSDLYKDCAQLLKIPEEDLVRSLGKSDEDPDAPAKVVAKNLRALAKLAGRLKEAGVEPEMARMILRMEARERAAIQSRAKSIEDVKVVDGSSPVFDSSSDKEAGVDAEIARMILRMEARERAANQSTAKSIEDVKVADGWSPVLNPNADKDLPTEDLMDRARDAAVSVMNLHAALQDDPEFNRLTAGDAEDIYFRILMAHRKSGYGDCKSLAKLRENGFSDIKKILRSGVRVDEVYRRVLDGAASLDEAIECARLGVELKTLAKVKKIKKTELNKWKKKGFSDVEIAAYRGNLKNWATDRTWSPPRVLGNRALSIDDSRMDFFRNSNLTAGEANSLLVLGLVPPDLRKAPDLPAIELRHNEDSHVLSDEPGGKGSFNEVRLRTIRRKNGDIDRRVFKPVPLLDDWNQHLDAIRKVGANLAASTVNEQLGFDAIVHTQLSTRHDRIGISMELAKGYTPYQLLKGDVFLTVPKDEPKYKTLHDAVMEDMRVHGTISEETRNYAAKELKFTRLRMVGQELQAAGDFMTDLIKDPAFQKMCVDLQIVDFITDELDRHLKNLVIDLRLGPNGATAIAVKGIDNDGGFAAHPYHANSIRTAPRVMSRQQADAIKKAFEESTKNRNGIKNKLKSLVATSDIYKEVNPDVAFPFKHSRNATAANLPPPENGDQASQSMKRLEWLYNLVVRTEEGDGETVDDGKPVLTIISDPAPENGMNEQKKDVTDEPEINFGLKLNLGGRSDSKETWGSQFVFDILTNTSSIIATQKMSQG